MAHGNEREGKWRGNWRMEWVASTLHTTSEHGVSSITTADTHTSAASSRLNWRPSADLNGLVRFARKTKSGFCACAITFHLVSTTDESCIKSRLERLYLLICGNNYCPYSARGSGRLWRPPYRVLSADQSLSPSKDAREVKPTTWIHLVSRILSGAIPPSPNIPSLVRPETFLLAWCRKNEQLVTDSTS